MCSRCATRGRKPKADRPESHGPRSQARQRSSTARLAGRHRELNSIFVLLDQAVPRCSPLQTALPRSGRFMTHEAPAARQWSVGPCLRSPQPQFHLRALWSFALRCFPTCGAGPGLPYMVKVLKVTRLVQVTRGLRSLLFWQCWGHGFPAPVCPYANMATSARIGIGIERSSGVQGSRNAMSLGRCSHLRPTEPGLCKCRRPLPGKTSKVHHPSTS